jgi:hypothetical protein
MTAAATWNIICDQGKTLIRTIKYGSVVNNTFTPFDNTSWNARMQLRSTYSSDDAIVSLTSSGGDIVLGGNTGEITFTISSTVMANIVGKYVYDLELYQGSNPEVVRSPVRGEILVRPEVTK